MRSFEVNGDVLIEELIKLIGEERVLEIAKAIGSKRINFQPLASYIRRKHIQKSLDDGESIAYIARKFNVGRPTVYRVLKMRFKPKVSDKTASL